MRVIFSLVVLVALALATSGFTAYFLERNRLEDQTDESLDRTLAELQILTKEGVDPRTGEGFVGARDLLRVAMQRHVPSQSESTLGFVAEQVVWTPQPGVHLRLETDEEFVAHVTPLTTRADVTRGVIRTSHRDYRYIVIPVKASTPEASGALVVAYDWGETTVELNQTYRTFAVVALAAAVLTALILWLTIGRLLAPLRLLGQTAREINDHDLTRRIPVEGNDDVSVLTGTINDMLDRIEAAMVSQRQLLDDVGHELRTPLTIVRGHLELLDPSDQNEVENTRKLAVGELDRMNRLVGDLLVLAKTGRPDFLQIEDVDIARVTDETLEKARSLGNRKWLLEEVADVTIRADEQRLVQAMLQLASNAVKYSTTGTSIWMGSQADANRARMWVRDEGVGVLPEDLERILDRFARTDSAISGRIDGAGLGLAIVSSIVAAHGGKVDIRSQIGQGSTFEIVIPRQGAVSSQSEEHPGEPDSDR